MNSSETAPDIAKKKLKSEKYKNQEKVLNLKSWPQIKMMSKFHQILLWKVQGLKIVHPRCFRIRQKTKWENQKRNKKLKHQKMRRKSCRLSSQMVQSRIHINNSVRFKQIALTKNKQNSDPQSSKVPNNIKISI